MGGGHPLPYPPLAYFDFALRHAPVYTYIIISSSLKPYQNFGPDLSPDCLLMLSVVLPTVVIHDQRDRQFQNRPRVFYQVARVVSVAMTRENIHYKTPNT